MIVNIGKSFTDCIMLLTRISYKGLNKLIFLRTLSISHYSISHALLLSPLLHSWMGPPSSMFSIVVPLVLPQALVVIKWLTDCDNKIENMNYSLIMCQAPFSVLNVYIRPFITYLIFIQKRCKNDTKNSLITMGEVKHISFNVVVKDMGDEKWGKTE